MGLITLMTCGLVFTATGIAIVADSVDVVSTYSDGENDVVRDMVDRIN